MYTLILTILMTGSAYGGPSDSAAASVTPVHGFADRDQCMVAASAWLNDTRKRYSEQSSPQLYLAALCVQNTGKY